MKLIYIILIVGLLSGCTTLITAPISATGTVVSTSLDIIGSTGGAIVHTITGNSSDND